MMKKKTMFFLFVSFICFFASLSYADRLNDKTDRPGGDYKHVQASSASNCAQKCYDESQCKSFTFNKNSKDCWLKNSVPAETYSFDGVSGVKPTVNMRDKTDRPGGDYKHVQALNALDCSEKCYSESQCKSFTFNKNSKDCWLKDSVPAETYSFDGYSGTITYDE